MVGPSVGIAAWGMMTGVASLGYGLSPLEAMLISTVVFAGSAQMAAMPLMLAGAPLWVIWATALCVNLRFVVFSAHLRDYFMHIPTVRRLSTGYFFGDLSYVMLTRRYSQPPTQAADRQAMEAYVYGMSCINVASWMGAAVLGVGLAQFIPSQWGLGFAGILALVGITCSLASTRLRVLAFAVASVVAVLSFALPLKLNILVAIAAATFACLLTQRLHARMRASQSDWGAGGD